MAAPRRQQYTRQRTRRPTLERLEQRCLLDAGISFIQTSLLSSVAGVAAHTDSHLLNPWGFSETSDGQFRISANADGSAPLVTAQGNLIGQAVILPPALGSPPGTTSTPNGNVGNTTSDFVIRDDGRSAPASVLFSTEDGTIVGFNAKVDKTHAVLAADQSLNGAVYKLLAMGDISNGPNQGNYLYATNFHNDTIDVFDKNFHKVDLGANGLGTFADPNAVAGFAPFGVKNINGTLFVSYAKQNDAKHDDVAGAGNGFIDEFDTSGHFIERFASGTAAGGTLTELSSPIGMAVAPANFGPGGKFGGALLVGNFGDSHVSAFNLQTGAFLGQLSDAQGKPLTLNGGVGGNDTKGLWGIAFGNGQGGADTNTLFFAAGIKDEAAGLFGKVTMTHEDDDRGGHSEGDGSDHPDAGETGTPREQGGRQDLSSLFTHFGGRDLEAAGTGSTETVAPKGGEKEIDTFSMLSPMMAALGHTRTEAAEEHSLLATSPGAVAQKVNDLLFSEFSLDWRG